MAKDEITEMNQAMTLYEAGALDPKTLLTRVNFPDPQKTAEQTVLWLLDKMSYLQMNFPEVAQAVQQQQQQQMAQQEQMQQQQMQMEGQQAQQGMQVEGQKAQQQLTTKQQQHEQEITHKEQKHVQQMQQSAEASKAKLSANKASASLSKVKLKNK